MHEKFGVGADILIGRPRNNFRLHKGKAPAVLFAGGIGLTPLYAMAWQLHREKKPFALHISLRERERLPFSAELAETPFAAKIHLHIDTEAEKPASCRD